MTPSGRTALPRRGPWLALASAALLATLVGWVYPRIEAWRALGRAEEALGRLRGCLAGDALEGDLRRRAIAASMAREDWPARCGAHAAAAEVALAAAAPSRCSGDPRCEALGQMRGLLAELREALASGALDDQRAASLFEHAERLGLSLSAPPDPRPEPRPEPVAPQPLGAPLFVGREARRVFDPPLGPELRVLFHEPGRRARLCVLERDARCAAPHAAIPLRDPLALPASAPGAPSVVWVKGAEDALYHFEGGRILHEGAIGQAWVPLDGAPRIVAPDAEAAVAGETLVMTESLADRTRVHARSASGERDFGTVALTAPLERAACATPDEAMVLLTAKPVGYETPLAVVFVQAGAVVEARAGSRWFGFSCHGSTAALTWMEPAGEARLDEPRPSPAAVRGTYRIARLACRARGCTTDESAIEVERHHAASRYLVASVGEALAFAWRSPFGDVRLRVAPPAELPTASDRSILEDADHGGVAWEEGATEIVVRGERAFLFVERRHRDGRAVHVLSIDAAGAVVPLAP